MKAVQARSFLPLTLFCVAVSVAPALGQEDFRWRGHADDTGAPNAFYGGADAEDTFVALTCVQDSGGAAVIDVYVAVRTTGFAEGDAAMLEFYGPGWTASLPVTVDGPGLYESVSARIGFGADDTLYRSLFNNVGEVSYRLRPDLPPDTADFSAGREEVVSFMADCEASGGEAQDAGPTLQP